MLAVGVALIVTSAENAYYKQSIIKNVILIEYRAMSVIRNV